MDRFCWWALVLASCGAGGKERDFRSLQGAAALERLGRVVPGYHRPPAEGTETIEGRQTDVLAVILLGLAVALGAARLWGLGSWSLWLDEAFTLADARHREGIPNPVGYALFRLFYAFADGRPDEFQLRLPAALSGWLAIVATWWAFRPFVHRRVATAAALILACSTWHVYWSQNARFYTLAQLASVVAGGLVLRGLWRQSPLALAGGFATLALGALVHPSVALAGVGLLLGPWALRWLGQLDGDRPMQSVWRMHYIVALVAVFGGSGWLLEVWSHWDQVKGGGNPMHFVLSTGFVATPLLGLGFGLGVWQIVRKESGSMLLILIVAVVALGGALGLSFFARVSAQYVFALLPWMAVVAAAPLAEPAEDDEPGLWPRWKLAYLALLLAPMLVDTGLYFAVRNGDRPKWREAYEYVFDHREPYDLVLGMEAPVGEYYLSPEKDDLRRWEDVVWLDRYRSHVAQDWARYPRRTWLVVNREQLEDWSRSDREEMLRFLDQDCRLVQSYPIYWTPRDLDVEVFLHE